MSDTAGKEKAMKARFHLPGFTQHFMFNITFAEMLKHCSGFFREGVEIASVYGTFPPAMWNGGRFQFGRCDEGFIKQVIKMFNDRNIPLRFTFTNPVLEEKHLHDEYCNMIMRLADNGFNEVIVASPLLEEYIRKTYPDYKITSSTCKRITNADRLYSEVEKDYHIVVIDYDLNHDFDTLANIPDKKKCEILVNACCEAKCPYRSAHYNAIGKEQIAYAQHMAKTPDKPYTMLPGNNYRKGSDKCDYMDRSIFEIQELPNFISAGDIWEKYIPMGFEQFKIEGRTFNIIALMEHYMYYMIKPEKRDEARYIFMQQLAMNKVIKF